MATSDKRFTSRQVTVMVVAICLTIIATPMGVMAATGSFVNIRDYSNTGATGYSRVVNNRLVTEQCDSAGTSISSTTCARVVGGRTLVGDGSGSLTVDGKVTTVPGVPGTPYSNALGNGTTVPAGKRLVVETLSIDVDVTAGNSLTAFVHYTTGGNPAYLFVPISYAYTESAYDHYVATVPAHFYADAGTSVYVEPYSPAGTTGTAFFTASGYLL